MANPEPPRRDRSAGVSLLEVVVSLGILAVVFALFASAFSDASRAANSMVEGEFRAKATYLFNQLRRDVHSTQPSAGSVTLTANSISFFPITGITTTGPIFSGTRTIYSWNPSLGSSANFADSQILMSRAEYSGSRPVIGEVTAFTVSPLGTTLMTGFPATLPLRVRIVLTLTRKKVYAREPQNPEGRAEASFTEEITIPPG